MLTGRGGNIGLSVGDDGAFLIDDQFAPLTEKILAAVAEVSDDPVEFVVNTHWHGDHTGGNENLGKAGALIVAHDNVRQRMSTEQFIEAFSRTVPAKPEAALPVITFSRSVTFHWNDDELYIEHVEPAHTDGDCFVYFRKANVLHTGDLYFSQTYPFIDVSSGGNLGGMVKAADRMLELINDGTRVIPGHGTLSNAKGLREYRTMLETVRQRVAAMVAEDKSKQQVIDAKPTAEFDERWGQGWLSADRWLGFVYDGMTR